MFFYLKRLVGFVLLGACLTACNSETTTAESKDDTTTINKDTSSSTVSSKDADFVSEQVGGNYAEIKLAQLAQQKSGNAEIKDVAKLLETEHTAALNDLKNFAAKKNITIPSEENEEGKDAHKDLSEANAKDFDKKWCEKLMDKHDKSIKKYENADLSDAELKTWVSNILPKLRIHHDRLMQCHNKLK